MPILVPKWEEANILNMEEKGEACDALVVFLAIAYVFDSNGMGWDGMGCTLRCILLFVVGRYSAFHPPTVSCFK